MPNTYETKLWGGRFRQDEDQLMQRFNSGGFRTEWLVGPDIQGSLAHVAMQVKCGMLTPEEGKILTEGLQVHPASIPDRAAGLWPRNMRMSIHLWS